MNDPANTQPKTFTLQKHGNFENIRLNKTMENNRLPIQKPQRISLTHFLANSPRVSTPAISRPISIPNKSTQEQQGLSSPVLRSSASPERAYMRQNSENIASLKFSLDSRPRDDRRAFSAVPPNVMQHAAPAQPRHVQHDEEPEFYQHVMQYMSSSASKSKQLVAENAHLTSSCNLITQELQHCRAQLLSVNKELELANVELRQLRPAVASTREGLASKDSELATTKKLLSEQKLELSALKEEYDSLTAKLSEETAANTILKRTVDVAKGNITSLSDAYRGLNEAFVDLKKSHYASQRQIHSMAQEAITNKRLAEESATALAPLLDEESNSVRSTKVKSIIKELQDDLAGSHQVTDLLRDKLQHMGYQLAESQTRVKELEEEKRGALKDLLLAREEEKKQFQLLLSIENRMSTLSKKLSEREQETFDALAQASITEGQLVAAHEKLRVYAAAEEEHVKELQSLRVMKEEQVSSLIVIKACLIRSMLHRNVSKLVALQDIINLREKELATSKSESKALNESKAELRALLAEAKKELAQKSVALEARNPNDELVLRIAELEAVNNRLEKELTASQEGSVALQQDFKKLESELRREHLALVKANADLSSTNSLLRQNLEKLEERAKDAAELLKSSVPVEVMEKRCSELQDELQRLKREGKASFDSILKESGELKKCLEAQSVALFQAKEECSVLKERINTHAKQEDNQGLLIRSLEKRASGSEAAVQLAQEQFAASATTIRGLQGQLEIATARVKSLQDAYAALENSSSKDLDQRVEAMQQEIAGLKSKNDMLTRNAEGIVKRYETNLLTDVEKAFVGHLMDEARRIHEEGVVKKDNELRRRQHVVDSLNAKIVELQATVARLLKEKSTQEEARKAMVDFTTYVSSSPTRTDAEAAVAPALHGEQQGPARTSFIIAQDMPLAPQRLPADADSEDDVPLSRLSDHKEDSIPTLGNKRTRSSSPPVAEEPSTSKRRTKLAITVKPIQALAPAAAASSSVVVVKKKTAAAESLTKSKQQKRQRK
ncbi:hypothetical protein D9613_007309 [Agrocybe pediades]|uniref:Uncharacterized protein n=1 Tax=Agrocybe pediades TaxID=84607 RepID=A0A8H4QHG0_9AGAR|nr:hypothetical protein D9613_007309 [Agrocybe pediades]